MFHMRTLPLAALGLLVLHPASFAEDPCCTAAGAAASPACATTAPSACATSCATSCATGSGTRIVHDPARYAAAGPTEGESPADRGWRDLADTLEPIRSRFKVPGLAAAVVQNGRVVAVGVTGVRKAGSPERIGLDDRFHIGSCGKSFTATLAAFLVEDGTLSWESTIGDLLPEAAFEIQPRYRSVTLAQLLSHRSGFPVLDRDGSALWSLARSFEGSATERRAQLLRVAVEQEPIAMPGAAFVYTDLGYVLAGVMMEQAAGRAWEQLIFERVARPLGITTLGFGAPGLPDDLAQPWGHTFEDDTLHALSPGPGADLAAPVIAPAGTIHLSIVDWARFAAFHLDAARRQLQGDRSALSTLYRDPYSQGYGMGWVVTTQPWADGPVLMHNGSCGAWAAAIWLVPDADVAFVVASNYGGGEAFAACDAVVNALGVARLTGGL